jgi:hypothetical protein
MRDWPPRSTAWVLGALGLTMTSITLAAAAEAAMRSPADGGIDA